MIRVKDFAKFEDPVLKESASRIQNKSVVENVLNEIETISLSSEEDEVVKKKPGKSNPQKSKPTENKLPRVSSFVNRNRTPKPLQLKYHKISEYFQATKKECK